MGCLYCGLSGSKEYSLLASVWVYFLRIEVDLGGWSEMYSAGFEWIAMYFCRILTVSHRFWLDVDLGVFLFGCS